jgi:hypothetical protein
VKLAVRFTSRLGKGAVAHRLAARLARRVAVRSREPAAAGGVRPARVRATGAPDLPLSIEEDAPDVRLRPRPAASDLHRADE